MKEMIHNNSVKTSTIKFKILSLGNKNKKLESQIIYYAEKERNETNELRKRKNFERSPYEKLEVKAR